MRVSFIIPVVLALAMTAALAQTPEPTSPPQQQAPAAEAAIHAFGDRDKTCLAWTDKCRSCERGDDDTIHCSNIGIACQPAEISCSRRKEPAK